MTAAVLSHANALAKLRASHANYVRACGTRFAAAPYHARSVPGWGYDSTTDDVFADPLWCEANGWDSIVRARK